MEKQTAWVNTGRRMTLEDAEKFYAALEQEQDPIIFPGFLDEGEFEGLSNNVRALYAAMYSAIISGGHGCVKESERVYSVSFSREDMAAAAHVSVRTATKGVGILKAAGLVVGEERPGHGMVNRVHFYAPDEPWEMVDCEGRKRFRASMCKGNRPRRGKKI